MSNLDGSIVCVSRKTRMWRWDKQSLSVWRVRNPLQEEGDCCTALTLLWALITSCIWQCLQIPPASSGGWDAGSQQEPLLPGVSSSREQQREVQALRRALTMLWHCQNSFSLLFSLPFCQAGEYPCPRHTWDDIVHCVPPTTPLPLPLGPFPPESSTFWVEMGSACAILELIFKLPPGVGKFWVQG